MWINGASGLVSFLGVTLVRDDPFFDRLTFGLFDTAYDDGYRAFIIIDDTGDAQVDGVAAGGVSSADISAGEVGSFLVRPSSAVIPESSTLLLFGIGALGFIGYGWRRWKQNRKEK